jgi:hypothetical protein
MAKFYNFVFGPGMRKQVPQITIDDENSILLGSPSRISGKSKIS